MWKAVGFSLTKLNGRYWATIFKPQLLFEWSLCAAWGWRNCGFYLSVDCNQWRPSHDFTGVQARSQGIRKGGGVTFCGGSGGLPQNFFNLRWRIPQNLMIFFNCQRNFGCPNIFCSWRKCQTSCKRHSQRRSSMHETFEIHGYYMWWYCSGEWFGRVWKVWGWWEEYF